MARRFRKSKNPRRYPSKRKQQLRKTRGFDYKELATCSDKFKWEIHYVIKAQPKFISQWTPLKVDGNCCKWGEKTSSMLETLKDKTWREITEISKSNSGSANHAISISSIIKSARKELKKLSLDDLDELYSLRIRGKVRIWGIVVKPILQILWYDPNHVICPTNKKRKK